MWLGSMRAVLACIQASHASSSPSRGSSRSTASACTQPPFEVSSLPVAMTLSHVTTH